MNGGNGWQKEEEDDPAPSKNKTKERRSPEEGGASRSAGAESADPQRPVCSGRRRGRGETQVQDTGTVGAELRGRQLADPGGGARVDGGHGLDSK